MDFFILPLAVFFVWIAIGRPLTAFIFGFAPAMVRHLVMCAAILLMSWYSQHYAHPVLYLCLAVSGAVILFQGGINALVSLRTETPEVTVARAVPRTPRP